MAKISENFDSSEFKCKCCGELPKGGMNHKLIDLLQTIRENIGASITIMSGYRCEAHNKKVGGVKNSQHCLGTAADIRVAGMDADDVQHFLVKHFNNQIGGIGCYDTFTHVDVRNGHARWDESNKQ